MPRAAKLLCSSSDDACADGSTEGGRDWWERDDIAYCEYDFEANNVSLGTAAGYCGAGWNVCTSTEFTARNDDFLNVVGAAISGRLDDGEDCYAHDDNAPAPTHNMELDGVRSGYPGTCTGPTSFEYGRQSRIEDGLCAGPRYCGVLCCPD